MHAETDSGMPWRGEEMMNEPIVIFPWMIQELHLKGAALLVFALWYAERRDRSVQELAEMLDYSEFGIRKIMPEVRAAQLSCVKKQQSCENPQLSCKTEKERSKEKEKKINNLCLVDLAIDDASHDATNAEKKMSIEERKKEFWGRLVPYIEQGLYTKEMVTDFYLYWTEANERGKRMRFDMEKIFELRRRLATWRKREEARNYGKTEARNYGGARLSAEQLRDQLIAKRRREESSEELLQQMDAARAASVSYREMLSGTAPRSKQEAEGGVRE